MSFGSHPPLVVRWLVDTHSTVRACGTNSEGSFSSSICFFLCVCDCFCVFGAGESLLCSKEEIWRESLLMDRASNGGGGGVVGGGVVFLGTYD